ncbi:YbbR-like domain-containing protein [Peribacillus saganii]|uniref:YbbR-like domain-containing protein n=1 Tax=Peribacillus saganii TaxID=2303992 RepID=A0A372LPI8_9BACI|nr:CdaR family protein [Peribacillus saganii]RFU69973.1 YbbR-like domain-containing protein [Peribacillus saganii]
MDRLMNSSWFIKVVSLVLAILLAVSVSFQEAGLSESPLFSPRAKNGTEKIQSVPVEVWYDRENLVVSGEPKTVDVTLEGPKVLLLSAKNQRDFKVYIDLTDPEISMGDKRVPIKIKDINEKIKVSINPVYAQVSVQEKITKEFKVEAEYDRTLLEDGYTSDKPDISPERVSITGAKDIIDRISYVKATIELSRGVNGTVHREARVRALDREFNKLNVIIDPETVNASLTIRIPSKTVPIKPVQSGSPKNGVKISAIQAEPKEITLFGEESVLSNIGALTLPIDVSKINNSTTFNMDVNLPEGVQRASRKEVTVTVKAEPENQETADPVDEKEDIPAEEGTRPQADKTRTISKVNVQPAGLPEDYQLEFVTPAQGQTDVTLKGSEEELKKINDSDILLSIDVSNLEEGEHTVDIKVKAPAAAKWELASSQATVKITKVEKDA